MQELLCLLLILFFGAFWVVFTEKKIVYSTSTEQKKAAKCGLDIIGNKA